MHMQHEGLVLLCYSYSISLQSLSLLRFRSMWQTTDRTPVKGW